MNTPLPTKEFVLFGASGDLAKEKLYPALFDIFKPTDTTIRYLGYARTPMENSAFQALVKAAILKKNPRADQEKLADFIGRFSYQTGNYDASGIAHLVTKTPVFRYYYLALPSSYELLKNIVEGLATNHLEKNSLIVLEKPFGTDEHSAKKLNALLLKHFSEEQIYRIDHYLAKDLVQDMLALRFANPLFAPVWNNEYIESITISIKEAEDIRERGQYYDQAGAIKDMIQNHAMQLLALTVMRQPADLSAPSIHKEKRRIFKKLGLFGNNGLAMVTIGQYAGYREAEHISPTSLTETYASLTTEINLPEWRGVPITIESGKKLSQKTTDIIITFKKVASNLWIKDGCDIKQNQIRINVQPDNDIHLTLNSEFNPADKCALPTTLRFGFKDNKFLLKDPYENALYDLFLHDQSIFIGSQEILLAWHFIDHVLTKLKPVREKKLQIYNRESDLEAS